MEGERNAMRELKIVVAVDESEESMHALSWCLSNLVSHYDNCRLVLLYVNPPPPAYSSIDVAGYVFSKDVISTMEKYGEDLVISVMKRAEAIHKNYDVKLEKVVGSGEAKDVICKAVDKIGADILVMGSHGYGFLKRALLGSVSDHCGKYAKVSGGDCEAPTEEGELIGQYSF